MNETGKLIFRDVTNNVFLYLANNKDAKQIEIAKATDVTYSHIAKVLPILESEFYITSKKKGREKIINLTEKGNDVAILIYTLKQKVM